MKAVTPRIDAREALSANNLNYPRAPLGGRVAFCPGRTMAVHGVLLVDKPVGMTSFDVLRVLRKVLKTKSLGHAGTLDPFASGLLVVCVGDYTRFAGYLTDDDKVYAATLRLGEQTNTDDCEGEILASKPLSDDWQAQLEASLDQFRGPIQQVPPQFSAIHVDGKRAYALAREGKEVTLAAREVTVERLELDGFEEQGARLIVKASKGTYIRSIARDIGQVMGCGGHLVGLRRLQSGAFLVERAHNLEALKNAPDEALRGLLQGREALPMLPAIDVDEEGEKRLFFGQPVSLETPCEPGLYVAYGRDGVLLGLVDVLVESDDLGDHHSLKVRRMMPQASIHAARACEESSD